MPQEDLEREDKYTVPAQFDVPDLSPLGQRVESETFDLVATYYDTEASHLQRRRVTMRRRTGGHDAGWHVKLPAGDARTELRVDDLSTTPPADLVELLTGVRGAQQLVPVARLHTLRTTQTVHRSDERDLHVVEVADDVVTSMRLLPPERVLSWREVEVELGPGGGEPDLLVVRGMLEAVGAEASVNVSSFATAMGSPVALAEPEGLRGRITGYLRTQVDVLADGDLGLRRGADTVYPMRVAVRRIRSTLRTYAGQLDARESRRLDRGLTRLMGLLGDVRDQDVLAHRFYQLADELAASGDQRRKAAREAARYAEDQRARAHRTLMKAVSKRRYVALVADLDRWHHDAKFAIDTATDTDREPASAAPYIAAARSEVSDRLVAAVRADASDHDLHQLRKAYKRLRYALELALEDLEPQAVIDLARAREMQDVLGEYQDSVMTIAFLELAGSGGHRTRRPLSRQAIEALSQLEHDRAAQADEAARRAVRALTSAPGSTR